MFSRDYNISGLPHEPSIMPTFDRSHIRSQHHNESGKRQMVKEIYLNTIKYIIEGTSQRGDNNDTLIMKRHYTTIESGSPAVFYSMIENYRPAALEEWWITELKANLNSDDKINQDLVSAFWANKMQLDTIAQGFVIPEIPAHIKAILDPLKIAHDKENWLSLLDDQYNVVMGFGDQHRLGHRYDDWDKEVAKLVPGYFRVRKEIERYTLERMQFEKDVKVNKMPLNSADLRMLHINLDNFFTYSREWGEKTAAAFKEQLGKL